MHKKYLPVAALLRLASSARREGKAGLHGIHEKSMHLNDEPFI